MGRVGGVGTDVCVLAAVLGAVDRGYRVVVPTDALCSSSAVKNAVCAAFSGPSGPADVFGFASLAAARGRNLADRPAG
jgi:hypothetical protein